MASLGLFFRTLATRLSSAARERGASAPEYALLLTVVVGGSLVALGQLQENTEDEVVTTASQIGSMPTIIGFVPIDTTISPSTTSSSTSTTSTTTTTTTTSTTTTVAPTTTAASFTEKLNCQADEFTRSGGFRLGVLGGTTDVVGTNDTLGTSFGGPNGVDFIECTFSVAQAGTYEIEADIYAPNEQSNSFFVEGVGQGSTITWRPPFANLLATRRVIDFGAPSNLRVNLGANTNYPIKISLREDFTWLSEVRLVLVSAAPTTTVPPTTTTSTTTTSTTTTTTVAPDPVATLVIEDRSDIQNGVPRARTRIIATDDSGNKMVGAQVVVKFTTQVGDTSTQTKTLNTNGAKWFTWTRSDSDFPITVEVLSVTWNGTSYTPSPSTATLQRP